MSMVLFVGIAESRIATAPRILACSALGSCVGVCLWDADTRLAGLIHILLPHSKPFAPNSSPYKYADTGISRLVEEMESLGATRRRLRAKLVGGACLYRYERDSVASEIGERNIEAARQTLSQLHIPILAEHVGGGYGRSIRVEPYSFDVQVTVLAQDVVVI